jgi:hypothetical protein
MIVALSGVSKAGAMSDDSPEIVDRLNGMSAFGVRRENAALPSWCKAHPATAPAGSNRSSYHAPIGRSVTDFHGGPTVKRLAVFLQCKMTRVMWWTVPAPGNEVP